MNIKDVLYNVPLVKPVIDTTNTIVDTVNTIFNNSVAVTDAFVEGANFWDEENIISRQFNMTQKKIEQLRKNYFRFLDTYRNTSCYLGKANFIWGHGLKWKLPYIYGSYLDIDIIHEALVDALKIDKEMLIFNCKTNEVLTSNTEMKGQNIKFETQGNICDAYMNGDNIEIPPGALKYETIFCFVYLDNGVFGFNRLYKSLLNGLTKVSEIHGELIYNNILLMEENQRFSDEMETERIMMKMQEREKEERIANTSMMEKILDYIAPVPQDLSLSNMYKNIPTDHKIQLMEQNKIREAEDKARKEEEEERKFQRIIAHEEAEFAKKEAEYYNKIDTSLKSLSVFDEELKDEIEIIRSYITENTDNISNMKSEREQLKSENGPKQQIEKLTKKIAETISLKKAHENQIKVLQGKIKDNAARKKVGEELKKQFVKTKSEFSKKISKKKEDRKKQIEKEKQRQNNKISSRKNTQYDIFEDIEGEDDQDDDEEVSWFETIKQKYTDFFKDERIFNERGELEELDEDKYGEGGTTVVNRGKRNEQEKFNDVYIEGVNYIVPFDSGRGVYVSRQLERPDEYIPIGISYLRYKYSAYRMLCISGVEMFYNNGELIVNRGFIQMFANCSSNEGYRETYGMKHPPRFFMWFLLIDNTHYNLLIYNTKKMTLERFNPHVAVSTLNDVDLDIIKYFKKIDAKIKYFKPTDLSFLKAYNDDIRRKYRITMRIRDDQKVPEGSEIYSEWYDKRYDLCYIWSLWYADLRLKNPTLSQEEIVKYATDNIYEKHGSDFERFIFKYKYFLENVNEYYNRNPEFRNVDIEYFNPSIYGKIDIVDNVLSMFMTPEERKRKDKERQRQMKEANERREEDARKRMKEEEDEQEDEKEDVKIVDLTTATVADTDNLTDEQAEEFLKELDNL